VHEDLSKQPIERRARGDPAAERSETVRKLNMQLRRVFKWLPHDRGYPYNFYCECGCCESVQLTIAEYDALEDKPVYLAGHPAAD